jgi:DNA primase large subunit
MSRDRFLRVVEGHLRNRFEGELPLEVNPTLLRAFEAEIIALRQALRDRRSKLQGEDLGAIRVTNFPPCMEKLLAAVLASENVSHPGRFALVSFMNNIGLGFEEIYQIFASVPDFRESVTRYQIEHITGQISSTVYTAPECSTMVSYGICPGPDRLCETITHPLSYYRKKTRMSRFSSKKAPEEKPANSAA